MPPDGEAGRDAHVLLVVSVSAEVAEFASDILWSAGAQAIEEIAHDEFIDLRTDLGIDPLRAWSALVESHPPARTWPVRTTTVDSSVADTWRRHATPTTVEHVRIVPAWQATPGLPSSDTVTVLVEPGGSFGIGDHPTTRATLGLALRAPGTQVLDLGCGSGVLGIALCLTRGARVVAVDIAPAAIEATQLNLTLNDVEHLVVVEHGDVRVVKGTYDLVLANILAPVLLADADEIAARVAARGTLILSGFTDTRRADIVEAYAARGLELRDESAVEGWLALQFERIQQR